MKRLFLFMCMLPIILTACQSTGSKDTIAELRHVQINIKDEMIDGGLDKAMQSYQRFLEEAPDTALAPEAIRRLADLKVDKEYGTFTEGDGQFPKMLTEKTPSKMDTLKKTAPVSIAGIPLNPFKKQDQGNDEPEAEFEKRTTQNLDIPESTSIKKELAAPDDDLERAGPLEAIALYEKLLKEYPLYDHNDQVLYQMSRAYEELGRIEEAMTVMEQMVREYPMSRYIDEVHFRRAEYFFVHRKYLDAEEDYKRIVSSGGGSSYYELALYKLGWTFYKQELYDEAQQCFIALLDHKVSEGYDFDRAEDEADRKRMDDTFRVISLGFSNLGGPDTVVAYFSEHGKRSFEDSVYSNLGEFYFDKRRYADASATYNAFVERNRFHKKSPNFHMRVIEIHTAGGFPSLVLDAKKAYSSEYGLKAEYWQYFDPKDRQDVLDSLKTNLVDLAHHYHSAYQKPHKKDERLVYFMEAHHWYREFLASFPKEKESPDINYQLAELLLENNYFAQAAVEYEKTAYDYPAHDKSSEAGYAAVYALRKQLEIGNPDDSDAVKQEAVRISMKFIDTFPGHERAGIVLGSAAEDMFAMLEYEKAMAAGNRIIENYPNAEPGVIRTAWLVTAHSAYELEQYDAAEAAYIRLLSLVPDSDKTRAGLVDNLAASVYKQGEQANAAENYRAAADHFLRVGRVAPASNIRANADFDGAAALIQLKDWGAAAEVLNAFRIRFPGHELQAEVTKKIAYVYQENGRLSLAAREFERIEAESLDEAVRQDALQIAADLYQRDGDMVKALLVYRRYVANFPKPLELNLETRNKIAEILKTQIDRKAYLHELEQIVAIEASAGDAQTTRTRYLSGKAVLVLAQETYEAYLAVKLVKPIEENMQQKQDLMKKAIKGFNSLMDYASGELTAAATFHLAEIYSHFSQALMTSERPALTFDYYIVKPGENLSTIAKRNHMNVSRIARENNIDKSNLIVAGKKLKIPRGLYPEELEQYELAIEEQVYPFEEKAINIHESNLKLISLGVYNEWVDKSLQKLAKLVPSRYDKPEKNSEILRSIDTFSFKIARPAAPVSKKPDIGVGVNAEAVEPFKTDAIATPGDDHTDIEAAPAEPVVEPESGEGNRMQASPQTDETASVGEKDMTRHDGVPQGQTEATGR